MMEKRFALQFERESSELELKRRRSRRRSWETREESKADNFRESIILS